MSTNPQKPTGQPTDDSSAWAPCPAGELGGLATRLKARDRKRQQISTLKTVGASAMVAGVLMLGVGLMRGDGIGRLGGISCNDCIAQFDNFNASQAGEVVSVEDNTVENNTVEEAMMMKRVAAHLADCKLCREKFQELYPGVYQQAAMGSLRFSKRLANAPRWELPLAMSLQL